MPTKIDSVGIHDLSQLNRTIHNLTIFFSSYIINCRTIRIYDGIPINSNIGWEEY